MRFKYIGESPNGPFEMYGHIWENGTENDVTDGAAVKKLEGNRFFEAAEAVSEPAPKKRGPKSKKDVNDGEPDDAGAI